MASRALEINKNSTPVISRMNSDKVSTRCKKTPASSALSTIMNYRLLASVIGCSTEAHPSDAVATIFTGVVLGGYHSGRP